MFRIEVNVATEYQHPSQISSEKKKEYFTKTWNTKHHRAHCFALHMLQPQTPHKKRDEYSTSTVGRKFVGAPAEMTGCTPWRRAAVLKIHASRIRLLLCLQLRLLLASVQCAWDSRDRCKVPLCQQSCRVSASATWMGDWACMLQVTFRGTLCWSLLFRGSPVEPSKENVTANTKVSRAATRPQEAQPVFSASRAPQTFANDCK